jgi:hypothetical protein
MLSIISSGNWGFCSSTVPIREPPLYVRQQRLVQTSRFPYFEWTDRHDLTITCFSIVHCWKKSICPTAVEQNHGASLVPSLCFSWREAMQKFQCQCKSKAMQTFPTASCSIFYHILASCCTVLFNGFWGYVSVCMQLYCRCFPVLHLVLDILYTVYTPRVSSVSSLYCHYMFRPSWAITRWLKYTIMTSKWSLFNGSVVTIC